MIRLLEEKDYLQYYKLINEFRKTDFSYNNFCNFINEKNIQVWIIEDKDKDEIIGTGTLLFERKLIHNFGIVAHIEDIVISKNFRRQNYGKILVENLLEKAKEKKCYKVILNCDSEIEHFYNKCNFKSNGIQMSQYL